jgi:hypothetical protein
MYQSNQNPNGFMGQAQPLLNMALFHPLAMPGMPPPPPPPPPPNFINNSQSIFFIVF